MALSWSPPGGIWFTTDTKASRKHSAQSAPHFRRDDCITSFARYRRSSTRSGADRAVSSSHPCTSEAANSWWIVTQYDSVWMLCCELVSRASLPKKSAVVSADASMAV
jgi:hypothetical protein